MMDASLAIAVSGVLTAVIVAAGALLQIWLNGRLLRQAKVEDYKRQDQVAAQAAQAAELLLAANERVARQSADAARVTTSKLDQIHGLVNSTLTAQMEEAHGALLQQLLLTREVVALHTAAGRPATRGALDAIEALERKVAELGHQLTDRAAATVAADARAPQSKEDM